jgi:hypothetical protein
MKGIGYLMGTVAVLSGALVCLGNAAGEGGGEAAPRLGMISRAIHMD